MIAAGRRDSPRGPVAAPLFGFVVLGLPDGMLGVAWPAVRHDLAEPLAALGELLLASLAGYLAVTSMTGRALRHLGTGTVLLAAAVAAAAGASLFAATRTWGLLVLAAAVLGSSGGALDAALNTTVALEGRARFMNLMHAAYGIGAAVGPLAVTAAITIGSSWRWAYAGLAAMEAVLVCAWARAHRRFPPLSPAHSCSTVARPRLLVWMGLGAFFFYTGAEVCVASWAASFLRGPGGLSATLAGVAVFMFWAGLAAGRFGAAGARLEPDAAVRLGVLGAIAGSAVVWLDAGAAPTLAALALLGAGLGPIFPALVNLTPSRLGPQRAMNAVGWQLAAAGAGGAGLSALAGVVLERVGLGAFGPSVLTLVLALAVLNLFLERAARGPSQ